LARAKGATRAKSKKEKLPLQEYQKWESMPPFGWLPQRKVAAGEGTYLPKVVLRGTHRPNAGILAGKNYQRAGKGKKT